LQYKLTVQVLPEVAAKADQLKKYISKKNNIPFAEIYHVQILKRSIDARQKNVKVNLKVNVFVKENFINNPIPLPEYPNVSKASEILIIGSGPAGLFAALKCIELGYKPIVLERGKNVQERRRDLKAINSNMKILTIALEKEAQERIAMANCTHALKNVVM